MRITHLANPIWRVLSARCKAGLQRLAFFVLSVSHNAHWRHNNTNVSTTDLYLVGVRSASRCARNLSCREFSRFNCHVSPRLGHDRFLPNLSSSVPTNLPTIDATQSDRAFSYKQNTQSWKYSKKERKRGFKPPLKSATLQEGLLLEKCEQNKTNWCWKTNTFANR